MKQIPSYFCLFSTQEGAQGYSAAGKKGAAFQLVTWGHIEASSCVESSERVKYLRFVKILIPKCYFLVTLLSAEGKYKGERPLLYCKPHFRNKDGASHVDNKQASSHMGIFDLYYFCIINSSLMLSSRVSRSRRWKCYSLRTSTCN